MSFDLSYDADRTIRIRVTGQLIYSNRDELKAKVVEQLAKDPPPTIALDLRECGYIDSAGLGVIMSCSKKVRDKGGVLRVEGLNEDLLTLFRLTGLDKLLSLTTSAAR